VLVNRGRWAVGVARARLAAVSRRRWSYALSSGALAVLAVGFVGGGVAGMWLTAPPALVAAMLALGAARSDYRSADSDGSWSALTLAWGVVVLSVFISLPALMVLVALSTPI